MSVKSELLLERIAVALESIDKNLDEIKSNTASMDNSISYVSSELGGCVIDTKYGKSFRAVATVYESN